MLPIIHDKQTYAYFLLRQEVMLNYRVYKRSNDTWRHKTFVLPFIISFTFLFQKSFLLPHVTQYVYRGTMADAKETRRTKDSLVVFLTNREENWSRRALSKQLYPFPFIRFSIPAFLLCRISTEPCKNLLRSKKFQNWNSPSLGAKKFNFWYFLSYIN